MSTCPSTVPPSVSPYAPPPLTRRPPRGPKFHLLAHAVLSLAEVQDGFRTHDLAITSNGERAARRGTGDGAGVGREGSGD